MNISPLHFFVLADFDYRNCIRLAAGRGIRSADDLDYEVTAGLSEWGAIDAPAVPRDACVFCRLLDFSVVTACDTGGEGNLSAERHQYPMAEY